eukprot:12247001-Prorocentrum_lima.AAC.1
MCIRDSPIFGPYLRCPFAEQVFVRGYTEVYSGVVVDEDVHVINSTKQRCNGFYVVALCDRMED